MKIEIPLIFWHGNRDRIMSIDFYPNSNFLVTCGAESEDKTWIKLWEIEEQDHSEVPSINIDANPFKTTNKPNIIINEKEKEDSMLVDENIIASNQTKIRLKFLYDISGAHTATVNVVRFSPNGMYLASGGDDSAIVIWVQKSRPVEFGSSIEKVSWSNHKILRGHLSDIYDLSWSSDSKFMISGSVDNTAIIWNLEKGKGVQKLTDHNHFVQGVSWDPRNKYIVTLSSDKSARIYENCDMKHETKFFFLNQIKRNNLIDKNNLSSLNKDNYVEDKMIVDKDIKKEKNSPNNFNYYFADQIQCPSFFRRHGWSPDGSICLLVAGVNKDEEGQNENVVWGFSRKDMSKPCFLLPTLDKSATCVRFCPIIFEKDIYQDKNNTELIDLPYKMVFAIATLDSLFIYDTQNIFPKYAIANIHYQPITDLAWKSSSILAASSSDGYITFCIFEKDELGKPIEVEKLPEKAKIVYSVYSQVDSTRNVLPVHNVSKIARYKKKNGDESNENSNNKLISDTNSLANNDNLSNFDNLENQNNLNEVVIQNQNNYIKPAEPISQTNNSTKRRIVPQMLENK